MAFTRKKRNKICARLQLNGKAILIKKVVRFEWFIELFFNDY